MSPKLPRVTAAETLRALQRAGWHIHRQKGSHAALLHHDKPGRRVTLAMHAGETIAPKTLLSSLFQDALTADEFRALL